MSPSVLAKQLFDIPECNLQLVWEQKRSHDVSGIENVQFINADDISYFPDEGFVRGSHARDTDSPLKQSSTQQQTSNPDASTSSTAPASDAESTTKEQSPTKERETGTD